MMHQDPPEEPKRKFIENLAPDYNLDGKSSWWEWAIDGLLYAGDILLGGPTGESVAAKGLIVGITTGAKNVAKSGKNLFKFGGSASRHMAESGRAVPIQILEQAVKGSKGVADPKGSRALMHTTEMWKNGKAYNLEVLYDKTTNTIWHFKYTPVKP